MTENKTPSPSAPASNHPPAPASNQERDKAAALTAPQPVKPPVQGAPEKKS